MRLKRFISSVLLFSFLFPQICFAQSKDISPDPDVGKESFPKVELVPGEKDPGLALSPMKKGQKNSVYRSSFVTLCSSECDRRARVYRRKN